MPGIERKSLRGVRASLRCPASTFARTRAVSIPATLYSRSCFHFFLIYFRICLVPSKVRCYEPRWLLLGLETTFGEEIVPVPALARLKPGGLDKALRFFIAEVDVLLMCMRTKVVCFIRKCISGRTVESPV